MEYKNFKKGKIVFKADKINVSEAKELISSFNNFQDGYVAFSNCEKRISFIKQPVENLLDGRVNNLEGVEGYLMELGLWKEEKGRYYEIYIERHGEDFYYNYFELITDSSENIGETCFYKKQKVFSDSRLFSKKELSAIEVIIPEKRINIFLTVGGV